MLCVVTQTETLNDSDGRSNALRWNESNEINEDKSRLLPYFVFPFTLTPSFPDVLESKV
jgi:hypothetical protein